MIAAANNGKDIFCEKPLALEIDAIDRALAAVKANNVKLQLGFNRRFDPSFVAVRAAARRLGKLRTLHVVSRDPGPPPKEYLARCGGLFLGHGDSRF